MRQVLITKAGPPEVLRVVDSPMPEPKRGEVRVRVAAIGINFADVMGRLGLYPDAPKIPYVPGYEIAGTVDALGEGVDSVQLGDEVIALVRFNGYSEYVCTPAQQTFPKPPAISMEKAAGFPVGYLTAYGALVALAGIKQGESVLIHSAAGGVGLAAVKIASIFGATIYGTASPSKHDFLREWGVQHPIDYRSRDFETEVKRMTGGRGVNIALDPIGGRSWLKSYRSLSALGRLVVFGVTAMAPRPGRSILGIARTLVGIPWLRFNPITFTSDNKGVLGLNLGHLWDQQDAVHAWTDQLLEWTGQGRLDVHVDRVFKMEEAAQAHRLLQERHSKGKIVLVP